MRRLAALALLWACLAAAAPARLQARPPPAAEPYGLRLAFGDAPGRLTLTWSTDEAMNGLPCVQVHSDLPPPLWRAPPAGLWAGGGAARQSCGSTRAFMEPDTNETSYIHTAALPPLAPGRRHRYRAGAEADGWSSWRPLAAALSPPPPFFNEDLVPLPPPQQPPPTRLLIVGDLGVRQSFTLPDLAADAASGAYSALLHAGDLAYDLHQLQGRRAKAFLKLVEPLSSALPYMATPGNHEAAANFSHFRALWTMPAWADTQNLYYSYDVGPIHVVSFNTEVLFWPEWYSETHVAAMHAWLEADLAVAGANRAAAPWVVAVGHRPMYCVRQAEDTGRCRFEQEAVRRGLLAACPRNNPQACRPRGGAGAGSSATGWALEELLHRHGVDLYVAGHVHDYERYYPVHDLAVDSTGTSSFRQYRAPRATVHVTSGAGGNPEMRGGASPPPRGRCAPGDAPWCAFQSGFAPEDEQSHDWSYSRVAAHNASHLHWQFSHTSGRVVDEFWVVQGRHGPFL
jgi:hypothetical protein